jgi:uncharacterized protein YxjI
LNLRAGARCGISAFFTRLGYTAGMACYMMKQKALCMGSDYKVQDASGREVFYIDGRAFSLGNKLSFQDMDGNELAFISQKLLSWGPTYEITRGGELAAVVKKSVFTFLRCEFSVDVPGPDDLIAEGDFWDHEYAFSCGGRPVAQVSKRYFSWTDTYGIDIDEGQDDILIIASAVVIDLCCHQDKT